MVNLLSLKGNPVNITGEENIVNPGFYMPNRMSVAVGKALHKLLDGKVWKKNAKADELAVWMEKLIK